MPKVHVIVINFTEMYTFNPILLSIYNGVIRKLCE